MITFKNAGGGGTDYSKLTIGDAADREIEVMVVGSDPAAATDMILNFDQAVKLRDALTVWIKKNEIKPIRVKNLTTGTTI